MSAFYVIRNNDDLVHHGIKGQKWGIRRYQNEDGSLTEAGKKRYGSVEKLNYKMAKKEYNKAYNEAYRKTNRLNISSKAKTDRDDAINRMYDSQKKMNTAKEAYKKSQKKNKSNRSEIKADFVSNYVGASRTNAKKYVIRAGVQAAAALGTAAVGSVGVKSAAKKGNDYLAQQRFELATRGVKAFMTGASYSAVAAAWHEADYQAKKRIWG